MHPRRIPIGSGTSGTPVLDWTVPRIDVREAWSPRRGERPLDFQASISSSDTTAPVARTSRASELKAHHSHASASRIDPTERRTTRGLGFCARASGDAMTETGRVRSTRPSNRPFELWRMALRRRSGRGPAPPAMSPTVTRQRISPNRPRDRFGAALRDPPLRYLLPLSSSRAL